MGGRRKAPGDGGRGLEVSLSQAIADQRDYPAVQAMIASEDYVEGPKAFADKRKPQWKGR